MAPPTPYIESNAILAMQAGDVEEVRRLVADLLPNERRALAEAAENLAELCNPDRCGVCSGEPEEIQVRWHWACSPRRRDERADKPDPQGGQS